MQDESLRRLKRIYGRWRKSKRSSRERMPTVLVEEIRQAARVHGFTEVAKVTGLVARKIVKQPAGKRGRPSKIAQPPPKIAAFSRFRLEAPQAPRPLAEVEAPSGMKVRVFSREPEALSLLRDFLSLPKEEAS